MKKITIIILILLAIFLTSCSKSQVEDSQYAQYTSDLSFKEYASFSVDSTTYQLYELTKYDKGILYFYKIYAGSTNMQNWTLNYNYTYDYKSNHFFEQTIENLIYQETKEKMNEISNEIGLPLSLQKNHSTEERQIILNNDTNENGQLVTLEVYIPLRIDEFIDNVRRKTTFRYIPVYTYHLLLTNNQIDNYQAKGKISFDQFKASENILEK